MTYTRPEAVQQGQPFWKWVYGKLMVSVGIKPALEVTHYLRLYRACGIGFPNDSSVSSSVLEAERNGASTQPSTSITGYNPQAMKPLNISLCALVLFVVCARFVYAAELRALTSAALTEAYGELIPEFERATQIKVVTSFGGDDIPKRLEGGEPADVVIIWRVHLDKLVKEGLVVQGSEVDVVGSLIGVAVRDGIPKPDISSVDALRLALLNAKSIAYSASISGVYVSTELFPKLGITEQVKGKGKRIEGMRVGAAIARGDAEIGFQQISELLPISGIQYVGPLPPEVQRVTIFSAGSVKNAQNSSAVHALIRFLTSPAAAAVFSRKGLDPITAKGR
jgi:molybdate transport system substrate-binding protein